MIWHASGTSSQVALVERAIAACDFPFDKLTPSLKAEGRSTVRVEWADLSRYNHGAPAHEHAQGAHTIVREVDGRARVLGLFYLPPHTRVVLDRSLEADPDLAIEVFLAEAAHAVDYHYMSPAHRRAVVNALHFEDLLPDADVSDGATFKLDGHTCSWFDVGDYADWVGEAFMEAFIDAFAPSVTVTIALNHPTSPAAAAAVRRLLVGEPASEAHKALVAALERVLRTSWAPTYLRKAAQAWLASL